MNKYTADELNLVNSLNEPIKNIDINLVNSIIDKMIFNGNYEELIAFLNNLYDFANVTINIVDKLISNDNKECISFFLDNEDILYFLVDEEKNKLKAFLDVHEINIKLNESYDYYYKLLYKQGIRIWDSHTRRINDNIIEHKCTKYNKLIKLKLKEIKNVGVIASCIIYANYKLSEEEQILKGIDYLNEYGLNIDRDVRKDIIIM